MTLRERAAMEKRKKFLPEVNELEDDKNILTVEGDSDTSSSDDEVEERRYLSVPQGLRGGIRKASVAKRSFRTEEEVIMESHAEGDLEGVIAKALEGGLEDLTLNCFKFDALPASVFNCGGLITLTAHLNGMQTIPPQVDYLQMLTTLNVGQNELKTLPDEIGNLSSLTHLDCNRNMLESLPSSIARLEGLKTINLDYNCFSAIPSHLPRIRNLEKCFLCANPKIVTLDADELEKWKNIILVLDNTPAMQEAWAGVATRLDKTVNLLWNKVYPDEIMDFLYLGSVRTAQSEQVFKELGITRIVTAGKQLEIIDPLPEGIDQLLLNVEDITEQDLTPVFDTVDSYIEKARTDGARVLVHCFAGLSRSVTLVCAYLMKKHKMTFKEAITFVKKARPNANPNQGFRNQLMAYEKKLFGTSIDPHDTECCTTEYDCS
eukprot:TRINITY_DN2090_c0_g1_i1.p1 TRINITY_DN2090_c0_g1~~TRINITY_DN2090_c0_g1_i1.p1  ORF type:complete len:433 (+),score=123.39 TRINITY_DN2090_c0_g1_i1:55-1353(+)